MPGIQGKGEKMKAEIICIGTELLVGEILNTNSRYISENLTKAGVDLYYQTTVGDNFGRVKECLEIAFNRADLVITTGGLGPTMDDITKEAVADYFGAELELIQKYYEKIIKKYAEKGFRDKIASGAEKEASIIKGAELIENEVGLAPGFFFEKDGKKIIVLPGPPKELNPMVDNEVLKILGRFSDNILLMKTLEIKGVPEGNIDDRLKRYFEMSNPTVAPYAKDKSVHIRVAMKGPKDNQKDLMKKIETIISELKAIYPQAIDI